MAVSNCMSLGPRHFMKPADSRKFTLSPVLAVLLVIGIIVVLVLIGMFAMGEIVHKSYDHVDVTVQISGNDVVVTVIGGDDAAYVTGVCAYIDGTDAVSSLQFLNYAGLSEPIVFTGLARGVTGSAFVIVEVAFDDGTTGVVNYARLQFN